MIAMIIKYRWLVGGLLGLVFISGLCFTYHMKGYQKAKIECAQERAAETQRGIKTNEKIKTKIVKLSDPDLDKRLDKWLRDK